MIAIYTYTMEPLKAIKIDQTYQIPIPPSNACRFGQGQRQCYLLERCAAWRNQGEGIQFCEEGPVNRVERAVATQLADVGLYKHRAKIAPNIFVGKPVHVFCAPGDSVILKASKT
jgi:hypothetical protein